MGADEPSIGEYLEICQRSRRRLQEIREQQANPMPKAYYNMTEKQKKKLRSQANTQNLKNYI